MRVSHIAFYGSLRRGFAKHAELGLASALQFLGRRAIEGTVVDLGAYPGLVAGSGVVDVELYRILDATVLERIDEYEAYDPADPASLFVRKAVRVPRASGSGAAECLAWVYFFNGAAEPE